MAGGDTAALIVAMEAKLNKYEKDLDRSVVLAGQTVKKIEQKFSQANPSFNVSKIFAPLAALGGLSAIKGLLSDLAQLGDGAERIGVTTDALQSLSFVITQNGGRAETAQQGLDKFSNELGEAATKGGALYELLKANNVALRDQSGNLRSVDDMLNEFARLVAGASSQQEKMTLVTQAFGRRAGPQMLLALEEIARKGLPGIISASKEAGVVIDAALIKSAQKFDDAWDRAVLSVKASILNLATDPQMQALLTIISNPGLSIARLGASLTATAKPKGISGIGDEFGGGGGLTSDPTGKPKAATTVIPNPAFEKQIDDLKKRKELLASETATLMLNTAEREKARVSVELQNAATQAGIDLTPAMLARINSEATLYGRVALEAELARGRLAELNEASAEFGSALSSAFQAAVIQGQKLNEVLTSLANRLSSKAIDKLFDLVFAPTAGNSTSVFGGLLSSIGFGGARADGGPVDSGRSYLVGERGPELFMPKIPGTIMPRAGAANGSGSTSLHITYEIAGAVGKGEIVGMIRQGMAVATRQAVQIANAAVPGRNLQAHRLGA